METRVRRSLPAGVDTQRHRALASHSRSDIFNLVSAADTGLTAAEVARDSGLHPSTVRAHLDQLTDAGLLARVPDRHGSPGRPAWRYRVADTAAEPASRLYRELAGALVGHLAHVADNPATAGEQAGRDWGRRLVDSTVSADTPLSTVPAVDTTVTVLRELGFTPRVVSRVDDANAVIHLRSCPFLDLVNAHPDVVCGLHLGVIRGALGRLGSPAEATLEPFGEAGACVVKLSTARANAGKRRR